MKYIYLFFACSRSTSEASFTSVTLSFGNRQSVKKNKRCCYLKPSKTRRRTVGLGIRHFLGHRLRLLVSSFNYLQMERACLIILKTMKFNKKCVFVNSMPSSRFKYLGSPFISTLRSGMNSVIRPVSNPCPNGVMKLIPLKCLQNTSRLTPKSRQAFKSYVQSGYLAIGFGFVVHCSQNMKGK